MDVEKLFNDLESNNTQEYENAKKTLAEYFNQTKEQWYVQGMMEYYLKTSSVRIIEVIVKVQSPHDVYVFDRLSEWLRGHNRLPALTLFSFIVRKHPTWLYKVAKHKLIKDILKLLQQTEKEIIPLMSALLCIITLLPIIPSLVPNFLSDLFDVFGHLASWNCQNPSKLSENQLIHLQIGLYMLFHRLYGMYPCHFVHYLRDFIEKGRGAIFQHTIKPLLETVRMHPMLVTASKEIELNNSRWSGVEPHDVVVEIAKLSLEYCQESPDCLATAALRSQDTFTVVTPVPVQLQDSLRNTPFHHLPGGTSPFHSLAHREKIGEFHKFDSIWSPSIEILSTPPPTGTVPHTPTPSYGVPLLANTSGALLGATGASPPEAAVEATPETTPLKDINLKRAVATNSPAVRAILTTSQPSSPMRKEQSPFNFPDIQSKGFLGQATDHQQTITKTSQKLLQMINDRNQSQMYLLNRSNSAENAKPGSSTPLTLQDLQISNTGYALKSGTVPSLDSPTYPTESTQEDQEVTELTSQQMGPHHSDTLQDISNECDDCDETERSPCSAGGLHVPNNRSMRILAHGIRRNRMASCQNDTSCYLSYGTSPADATSVEHFVSAVANAKMQRAMSWPVIERRPSLEEISVEMEPTVNNRHQELTQQNGDSSSPSGEDAMSAATHFKRLQQKRDKKLIKIQKFDPKNFSFKTTCATQTIQQWPQIYEYNLLELLSEDNKLRNVSDTNTLQPYEILDQCIERTIKRKQSLDSRNREEAMRDQIHLLHLQLQYERYRREIHAERNRRLLGRSRAIRSLEMDNERLNHQLTKYKDDVQTLTSKSKLSRKEFNEERQELSKELNSWKSKYQSEVEDNKQLRSNIENLQRRLNEEIKNRTEINYEIEALRGDLFDMRNDMQQAQIQAELGCQYKQELAKLEAEFMVMGEIQVKCRDKLAEIDNLRARDDELHQLQESYNEEVKELRSALDEKTWQLDSAKHRLTELQAQVSNKEMMFTDQKRLLKSVKDEYEEKFQALNKKYEAQKAIILQMEEQILELSKNQMAVNLATFSPETSEKADMASSVDYNSPLSTSLASSDGLSASLRSVPELCNLQALLQPKTASGFTTTSTAPGTTAITLQQATITTAPSSSTVKRVSSSQHHYVQQTKTTGGHTTIRTSLGTTSSIKSSAASTSSTQSGTRQPGTSLDIPVPGPNQQHSNVRHHYSTHHR